MSTTSLLAGVVGEYPSGSIPRGMPLSQQKTQRLDDRSNFRESRIFRAGFFVHVELSIHLKHVPIFLVVTEGNESARIGTFDRDAKPASSIEENPR